LSVADRELIDRYLAGRLDDDACAQVEARIVADGAFRGEFELTEQLREGLHELEVRGELGSLDRDPRRFWQRPGYALAASVAAGLLGIAALALYGQLQDARTALVELQGAGALRPTVTGRTRVVTLARTRSSSGVDLVLRASEQADLLELRLDPGLKPAERHWATLERIEGNGSTVILSVPSLTPSPDGSVVLVVNSGLLQPGNYRVTLTPLEGADAAVAYRLRVEP
jgi:hypothetical protein